MGFDLRVHHRDKKTGAVIKTTPYILKLSKEHGTVFSRGNVDYHPDGSVKRDMRPKAAEPAAEEPVQAAPQAPVPVETSPKPQIAPAAEEPVSADDARAAELGVKSASELASQAKAGQIRRGK